MLDGKLTPARDIIGTQLHKVGWAFKTKQEVERRMALSPRIRLSPGLLTSRRIYSSPESTTSDQVRHHSSVTLGFAA